VARSSLGGPASTIDATPSHLDAGRVFGLCVVGAFGVLAVALVALGLYTMWPLLVQVMIALFIAISLDPIVRWMIRRGVTRPQAVAIIFVLAVAVTAILVWAFVPPMIRQGNQLITDFPGYLDRLRERSPTLRQLESRLDAQVHIDAWARTVPAALGEQALGIARRLFGAVLSGLLVLVLTVYLMIDLPRLRRGVVRLFPKRRRPRVNEILTLVIDKVGAYMIGNLVISAIAGATAFVMLMALGVPGALPLALLVAVTDLIPMIGATLGAAVCVIVSIATTDLWPTTVLLAAFFLVYQQIENYLIAPRVLRGTVDISSIAVLLAALIGASLFGVIGAVIAIPVAATLRVVLADRLRARDESADDHDAGPRAPADNVAACD
jgi:predicted PurR-regulated permease PerM